MVKRKRALIIVDVQPAFLRLRHKVVQNICSLLKKQTYDLYVESVFHAEKGSIWDTQTNWICPKNVKTKTHESILTLLPRNTIHILKNTKSAFKGNVNLCKILRDNQINEVHIVGLDTNDCILATAYESFDFGFQTFVLKKYCAQVHQENFIKVLFTY